ncbi:penicillin-binding protein PBP4 [Staphylococcus lugdunensis]|uniref:penicillin-binding protein PBP4 n=1 Tax=Staphylococcus lugdunensis TaxID=28035 RepID=UPI003D048E28
MRQIKGFVLLLCLCMMFSPLTTYAAKTPTQIAEAEKQHIAQHYNPKSMIVTTQQGQILYDYHQHDNVDPASITKLMTIYLVLDDIDKGKIKLTDEVKVSGRYAKMSRIPGLTTFPLIKGKTYTIQQLLKQGALASSNAAMLVLAEHIDGNSSDFTHRMNRKAQALHMRHTHFNNPSGADNRLIKPFAPSNYKQQHFSKTTAKDMAVLTQQLVKQHPKVLKITRLTSDKQHGHMLKNTNLSLPAQADGLAGADGLKTGTSNHGYNLALTAKQNNLRIHSVLFQVQPFADERAKHVRQQLSNIMVRRAFKNYDYRKVLSKGQHRIQGKMYYVKKDLYDVVPKDHKGYQFKINHGKYVHLTYQRSFLPGTHPPKVEVVKVSGMIQPIVISLCISCGLIIAFIFTITMIKNRKRI